MDEDKSIPLLLQNGRDIISGFVQTLPDQPGVYRMLGANNKVLYVGKAKSLKKRVCCYTRILALSQRLQRMVSQTVDMEFLTTHSEVEALLLEATLIKKLLPQYNILLRDDKACAKIAISKTHPFPQLTKTRSKSNSHWEFFGQYASGESADNTLAALYKAFKLRSCNDSYFSTRKRPCLQYHIKRCSAPCVDFITREEYAQSLKQARDVLNGKTKIVQQAIAEKMYHASEEMHYELASIYRDQIQALTRAQLKTHIHIKDVTDADIIAIASQDGRCCVQVIFYRNNSYCGSKTFFPEQVHDLPQEEILYDFISLFYQSNIPPRIILINQTVQKASIIQTALSQLAGHGVEIICPQRGDKTNIVQHAQKNAFDALVRKLSSSLSIVQLTQGLAEAFDLSGINRIEVYDNSHIQGSHAIGAMVVSGADGFIKSAYRKFNIKSNMQPGDDCAMMREVVSRRFANCAEQNFIFPDLMLIDGGKGQYNAVVAVLKDLGIGHIKVVAISKGKQRIAGEEKLYTLERGEFKLSKNDPVFYYIQRLRDEAHRFAINTHRQKRGKSLNKSLIDDIPHVGVKRKKLLLQHFGSAKAIADATVCDLQKAEGISGNLAMLIYEYFHNK